MSFAWFLLLKMLVLVGTPLAAFMWMLKSKDNPQGRTRFMVFLVVCFTSMILSVFTPIKLDNSVHNNQVVHSYDKKVKDVDIKLKPRVEYEAQ